MSLDPEARTAKIQGGEEVAFGRALIATGAMVNILRLEGAENEGIHYLRAFGNSDAIRADAEAAEQRGPGRRQLHRRRGRRLADRAGHQAARWSPWRRWRSRAPSARTPAAGSRSGSRSTASRSHGGEEVEAFEGDGRVSAVVDQERAARSSASGRRRRRRAARRDARPARRARGRRRRHRLRLEARDLGRGHLRRRRLLHLRQRRPRPPDPRRALGRGDAAGHPRRPQHARRRRRLRRRPLLLQRPRRLGEPRVRRPGAGLGRGDLARRPRGRRVLGLVPEGRPRRRLPSASSAPKTSPRRGGCSPTASTSRARASSSPTRARTSPRSPSAAQNFVWPRPMRRPVRSAAVRHGLERDASKSRGEALGRDRADHLRHRVADPIQPARQRLDADMERLLRCGVVVSGRPITRSSRRLVHLQRSRGRGTGAVRSARVRRPARDPPGRSRHVSAAGVGAVHARPPHVGRGFEASDFLVASGPHRRDATSAGIAPSSFNQRSALVEERLLVERFRDLLQQPRHARPPGSASF